MSKYLPHQSRFRSLKLAMPTVLVADIAQSQSQKNSQTADRSLPTAEAINKQIDKNYPSELLNDGEKVNPTASPAVSSTTASPGIAVPPTGTAQTSAIGSSHYTFILPTPLLIALVVVIGGIGLFPVVHLLLNSKKAAEIGKSSILSKWFDRFQKPQVLESDAFLHQRNFAKLVEITNKCEKMDADKFGNTEFMEFFKIKSYIARSMGEYTNLDEIIDTFNVAIAAQNSFSRIESIESRNCSSNQQELYQFVNGLFAQGVEHELFQAQVELKLQELSPRLKTEEGKVALASYTKEAIEISKHPLAVKLLLLFKKYQLDDYSILRSVANTINRLEAEDLLNPDSLMLLVMEKYEVFEKLGPIVGVAPEHNRPETYSKMLQYIGLKSRHEVSYQKFQEFLITLKQWDTHHQTIVNIRQKYNAKEYRLPKDFIAELPGADLYKKYKDSFHLITKAAPQTPPLVSKDAPVLAGVK